MSEKINYNQIIEKKIADFKGKKSLLLHSCCGPCSASVIEKLQPYFEITVFYYNPNIYPDAEYFKRRDEQQKYLAKMNVPFVEGDYEAEIFFRLAKGLELEVEGGQRCLKCFEMRLRKTAEFGEEYNFQFLATTLTVSPHKNVNYINTLGQTLEKEYNIEYLVSDFKKKEGYKRSLEISQKEKFYRQDYCGCIYSQRKK
ncbi:hypothetical protein AZF37_09465 [endosymbiont 'TC1' of Trimyema compressum]|uniref:epoxyqueuosine reductase QueH n=1 Tax=endosymbiont 'TC1' of Trimyema compressum TaxID=243899 RepID=UPI0007F0A9CD|nr:epoxyqueuosine reductase QueH [endosymbiont 'TC1' of Trimyema compressum]AMP21345.1 hypothetical protein AZF37_09465 [endosymbiont 'TC1' of Trimyema compressum]